jgi:uncharacterized protein involved in response to NO
MRIEEPQPAASAGFALWRLGFRPFYLLASVFACISVALWVLQYTGVLGEPYLRGAAWHGHEMLFGYTFAVIAGFLLTAVRNWTSQPTPTGVPLALLAALWVAGRVLVLTPYAIGAAFPLAVAVAIGVPLVRSRNKRNYFFIALMVMAGAAVLAFHLSMLGRVSRPPEAALQLGLDIVLFVVAVVAGRVVPMFTNNAVPAARADRLPALERAALASILALLAADAFAFPAAAIAAIALVAALLHGARLARWHGWRAGHEPLVWILHASYAWIVVHLVLRAAAAAGMVAAPLAIHALTVGAIGGMTLGMMTRTARGHTARALRTGRMETAAYALVIAAAAIRVFGPLLVPADYRLTVALSGACWSLAFAIYAVGYFPILTRARADGKPG